VLAVVVVLGGFTTATPSRAACGRRRGWTLLLTFTNLLSKKNEIPIRMQMMPKNKVKNAMNGFFSAEQRGGGKYDGFLYGFVLGSTKTYSVVSYRKRVVSNAKSFVLTSRDLLDHGVQLAEE